MAFMVYYVVVPRKFGHVLLVVALLVATGTHWPVLQSVAWAKMLAQNLRSEPFVTALQKTFDGQHPCCLCKQIAKEKQTQKKETLTLQLKRLEFISKAETCLIATRLARSWIPDKTQPTGQPAPEPLTPPPRNSLTSFA